ncbi:MAG: glycoside hydrolase family 2 protein, partial [Lachnospiraceae bacterium]|nr:glycoside hydrolase family 2 protein [Lachnospiraceae bacterium]
MKRQYFNEGWRFCPAEDDLTEWESVRLPHTVKELPFHYFSEKDYQMVALYEKTFVAKEAWKGKRVLLTFEGVAHKAKVYCNDQLVGQHACGYTAFTVDLSGALLFGGENLLRVEVDSRESLNVPPFGYVVDYLTYGGIYRDVYLEVKEPVHITDVFVRTKKLDTEAKCATLMVDVTISEAVAEDELLLEVMDEMKSIASERIKVTKGQQFYQTVIVLNNIEAWDINHPKLYTLQGTLQGNGESKCMRFGIRNVAFQADGF